MGDWRRHLVAATLAIGTTAAIAATGVWLYVGNTPPTHNKVVYVRVRTWSSCVADTFNDTKPAPNPSCPPTKLSP